MVLFVSEWLAMDTSRLRIQRAVATNQSLRRIAMSSNHSLEPKFGWGHQQALEDYKEELAKKVESLYVDSSWRPQEVINAVVRMIRQS